jgi:hypothetical protein
MSRMNHRASARLIVAAAAAFTTMPAIQSRGSDEASAAVFPVSREEIEGKTRSVTDPKDLWKYQHENMVTGFMGVMNVFGIHRTDVMLYVERTHRETEFTIASVRTTWNTNRSKRRRTGRNGRRGS